jgi:hypothetical protein
VDESGGGKGLHQSWRPIILSGRLQSDCERIAAVAEQEVEEEIADMDFLETEDRQAKGTLSAVLLEHAKVFKGTGCCYDAPECEIKQKKRVDPLLTNQQIRKRSPAEQRVEREAFAGQRWYHGTIHGAGNNAEQFYGKRYAR